MKTRIRRDSESGSCRLLWAWWLCHGHAPHACDGRRRGVQKQSPRLHGVSGLEGTALVDPEGRPWQGVPLALVNDDNDGEISPSWSYLGDPQSLMNPDEGWAENFAFPDVSPGSHHLITQIQGIEYQVPVQVTAGEVVLVEIVTENYKTPTPDAPQEITPTATISS